VPFAAINSPARATSTYRPAPQATNPEDSEELPPPPYASEDPEPDATRDLQIRLAAEAQAAGNLNLPEAAARRNEENEEDEGTQGNDRSNNNNEQGESSHASPPNSGSHTVQYAPLPDPPPTSSLQREESRRSQHQQQSPPTDAEEARILEESQLEEAMRLSKASERERLELEEAMRLSLAESEAETSNAQQSNDHGFDNSVFEGNEDHDSSGPSSRRISSYNPASQLEGNHRRAASDTFSRDHQSNVENASTGMDNLTIPDTWQSGGSGSNNLMDDDFGSTEFQQPALAPQRTGAVLQSKNPFLSPGERDAPSQTSGFIQPQASPTYTQNQALEGSPNEKRLPTIPGSEATSPAMYEPPPGPPPPSSNPTSPPSQTPNYLPPLPPRQPTLPVESSPNSQANSSPQGRRLPPRPQQPPTLPQRNVSASIYSASNLPTSSLPSHSPNPPTPSFFPPQPSPGLSPSPHQSADLRRSISTSHGGEDPLETLRDFHTVFMGTYR